MATWIKADGTVEEVHSKEPFYALEELQKLVGGYIEAVTLSNGDVMIVNEEGRLLGLPVNKRASTLAGLSIVGDVVIAKQVYANDALEFADEGDSLAALKQYNAHMRELFQGMQLPDTDEANSDSTKTPRFYWIAINGSSAALSPLPTAKPQCRPTPEQFVGFPTLAEAQEVQRFLLTAPIPEIEKRYKTWAMRKDIQVKRPKHPEPPCATTLWELAGQT